MVRIYVVLLCSLWLSWVAASGHPFSDISFDVIVVGSEPEGIIAAVAAAEEGARTLLLSEDARLGGLFVLGGLNTLDLRTEPLVQRGLFARWWTRVGRGPAFDTGRAEAVFGELLEEADVVVRLGAASLIPIVKAGSVVGVHTRDGTFLSAQTIDATSDGSCERPLHARVCILRCR